MKVYVNIKQAGKKRPVLEKKAYDFDPGIETLRGVLTRFTRQEAAAYNRRDEESYLLYENEEQVEERASRGKVGFGYRYNSKNVNPDEAVNRTLESYRDGLVRVFLNDRKLTELDETINIRDGDVFTFIRLTFLTGRMW